MDVHIVMFVFVIFSSGRVEHQEYQHKEAVVQQ
jgi:hypothetical protein